MPWLLTELEFADACFQAEMTSPIKLLADRGLIWHWKQHVVGHVDSIQLVSSFEPHDEFVRIVTRSLDMIRHDDQRRYKRVIKHIDWLVNDANPNGSFSGVYRHRTKSAHLDFEYDDSKGGMTMHAAYYAGTMVYLATHGRIHTRGIRTNSKNRFRKHQICRDEENRFLERMLEIFPELPSTMIRPVRSNDFRPSGYFQGAFKGSIRSLKK